jgi:hypothetical protein
MMKNKITTFAKPKTVSGHFKTTIEQTHKLSTIILDDGKK